VYLDQRREGPRAFWFEEKSMNVAAIPSLIGYRVWNNRGWGMIIVTVGDNPSVTMCVRAASSMAMPPRRMRFVPAAKKVKERFSMK
jgi:hypothetical protein